MRVLRRETGFLEHVGVQLSDLGGRFKTFAGINTICDGGGGVCRTRGMGLGLGGGIGGGTFVGKKGGVEVVAEVRGGF